MALMKNYGFSPTAKETPSIEAAVAIENVVAEEVSKIAELPPASVLVEEETPPVLGNEESSIILAVSDVPDFGQSQITSEVEPCPTLSKLQDSQ